MFKRWLLASTTAAVLAILPIAAQAQTNGGDIVVTYKDDITTLDPAIGYDWVNWSMIKSLFSRLMDYEPGTANLVPSLAESFTVSPDGLTYTFHLREGVKFHDGTPFNAQAVEFNVRRVWDPKFKYFYKRGAAIPPYRYFNLKDVKATDDNTVVFTLSARNAFFIEQLAEGASPGLPTMASPAAIEKYGNDDFGNHPAGTGPFMVKDQVKGQYVTLVRNPDYWNK
uniref:ABC transporter substrate-binding protein n=1 Tax=uncultured Rhizobium sp. TaxID=155567 RepID=UPI002620E138